MTRRSGTADTTPSRLDPMPGGQCTRVFGLSALSQLPGLHAADRQGVTDLEIRLGPTPAALSGIVKSGLRYQVARDEFLFHVDGVGRFHVEGGRRITVDPATATTTDVELAQFAFGLGLGILLQQRGRVVLHGAALASSSGDGVLLLGPSGVGKSTLCAALLRHGYRFISDELCVLECDAAGCWVTAGEPAQQLWPDALAQLSLDADGYLPLSATSEKRRVPVPAHRLAARARVGHAYVLGVDGRGQPGSTPVRGAAKLELLAACIYRAGINRAMWSDRDRFEKLIAVCNARFPVSRLGRPFSASGVAELCRIVTHEHDGAACGEGDAGTHSQSSCDGGRWLTGARG